MEKSMKDKFAHQIQEDALLREVVDDVKSEQLQQLWNKYGIFVIIGVALVLTLTISFESIRGWQRKKHYEMSNAYSVALSLQNQGHLDESLDIYNHLADKASGIYADLAKLQMASIYMEQDHPQDAVSVLEFLTGGANLSQMHDVAVLKLAAYKLDTKAPAEEISALLLPLIDRDNSSAVAHELLAMLYVREQQTDKALVEYEKIRYSANASDSMKSRAVDMMNILEE